MPYQADFQALLISGASVVEPIHRMWSDLTYALRARGIQALNFGMTNREFNANDFRDVLKDLAFWKGPKLLISPGAGTLIPTDTGDGRQRPFAEVYDIPVLSLLIDIPARFHWRLDHSYERSVITCVDQDYLPMIEDMGYPCRGTGFFPHGGPPPYPATIRSSDRALDVVFVGQVWPAMEEEEWLDEITETDHERQVMTEARRLCLREKSGIYSAFKTAMEASGQPIERDRIIHFLTRLERHIHTYSRLHMLKNLTSVTVDIYGGMDDRVKAALSHHRLHGPVTFSKGLEIMANAKVILNPVSVFRHGGHERIFYALSRGAIVASTETSFLQKEQENGLGMARIELDRDNDDTLSALLSGKNLDDVQQAGVDHYRLNHLWDHRIDLLTPILQKLF